MIELVTLLENKRSVTIFHIDCIKNPTRPGMETCRATSIKFTLPKTENKENIGGKKKKSEMIRM